MPVKREGQESFVMEPIICGECSADLRAEGWKIGPVVHCVGGHANVWGNWKRSDHHGHQHQFCAGCEKQIGCDMCIADEPSAARVCCEDCGIFADGTRRADPSEVRLIVEAALGR